MPKSFKEWLKIIGLASVIAITCGVLFVIKDKADGPGIVQEQPQTSVREWAVVNRDDPSSTPLAKVYVDVVEAMGSSSTDNVHIRGVVTNNANKDFSYIQVSIGLYTEDNTKVAACFDNMSNLASGSKWEFDMYCTGWRSATSYQVEQVTYF